MAVTEEGGEKNIEFSYQPLTGYYFFRFNMPFCNAKIPLKQHSTKDEEEEEFS